MSTVVLSANAKLTLSLRVTGVRQDGYHLLDSEMVSVDLCDTLEITEGSGLSLVDKTVAKTQPPPGGASNLVARAMSLVGESGHVRLTKRIPPGSGLGGGSSDAAAILRWAGVSDLQLAARLGADVPFCLRGGRARVMGIGEIVEPLEYEERTFLLAVPPVSVDTAAAYRAWDARRPASGTEGQGGQEPSEGPSGNDLERPAMDVEPRMKLWRDCFEAATGSRPRLAGSGSTWFVEGEAKDFSLEGEQGLRLGREQAALVTVKTVPPQIQCEE